MSDDQLFGLSRVMEQDNALKPKGQSTEILASFASLKTQNSTGSEDNIPLAQVMTRENSASSIASRNSLVLPEADKDCVCNKIHDKTDPRKCAVCKGEIKIVGKLYQEKASLQSELARTSKKVQQAILKTEEKTRELQEAEKKIAQLEQSLEMAQEELSTTKHDLEVLGEKLTDSIERTAELQHAKEALQDELEELTRSLFEEANSMVANEARQRHEHEVKGVAIAKQLGETERQLQLEQAQLRDLRIRYTQMERKYEDLLIEMDNAKPQENKLRISTDRPTKEDFIDPRLLEQFRELVEQGPRLKFHKIHNYIFMRNALEDEVIPCLRFGGNPLTSTKKFIDAIVANTCFIEEMDAEAINKLKERDEKIKSQQVKPPSPATATPTQSLFNKTVLERLTNALTISEPELPPPGGCSTCGKQEEYRFRFKISDVSQDVWCPICISCRDRLLAVVEFYQFIRNMRQGLYSTRPVEDLYIETLNLKRMMFYTRIGAKVAIDRPDFFTSTMPVRMNSSLLLSVE
ncbi:hypothetical protein EDD86DRAFT_198757 [Gorgonomyces haynaldii]|nr:hypothetical protein EDD86DRAFT_198757 [Gorgonomyces haynaldii]